jgi:hypothetical protein
MDPVVIGAVVSSCSAVTAMVSAFMSYRSSRASWTAVRETRSQRRHDQVRTVLTSLGVVHQAVVGLQLAAHRLRPSSPELVQYLADLQRSMLVSGQDLPACRALVQGETLDSASFQQALTELQDRSTTLGRELL